MRLHRAYPIRASLVCLAVAFIWTTILAARLGAPVDTGIIQDVLYLIGTAILGDTYRPSGWAHAPVERGDS